MSENIVNVTLPAGFIPGIIKERDALRAEIRNLTAEVARLTAELKAARDALTDIAHGPVGYWNLPEHHAEVISHMMKVASAALEPRK